MKRGNAIALICTLATVFALIATSQVAATGPAQATPAATQAASDPLGGAKTFAKADKPTKITVMLDWTPNTNHLGLYVAQAKGYYTEANLTVDIQQPGDVQVDQVVATGKAQFGVSYQEGFTFSRASGLPITSLAAIIQHNTSGFAAMSSKHPLKTPADLAGLRYGAFGSPIEKPFIEALIKCSGKADGKPVEFIDIGSTEPLPLMDKDRIDFVWLFYGWDGIRARQQDVKLDFIMLKDYTKCVPDYYTPILITGESMIKSQPDVVRAFVQATARGYALAIQNPGEAARILSEAAPDLDKALVKESAEWLAGQFQADAPRWGEQKAETWQGLADFMARNSALEKPVEMKGAFTNEFLPGKSTTP